jgi:uncharacterized coiled-coil DUF342 family protein
VRRAPVEEIIVSTAVLHKTLLSGIHDARAGADDYKASVYQLHRTSVRVSGLVLPKPKDPSLWPGGPDAYVQATRAWAVTSGNLNGWANSTLEALTSLPVSLANDSDLVVLPYLGEIVSFAEALVQNPGDTTTKNLLRNRVGILGTCFAGYDARTSALVNSLGNQAAVFTTDAAALADIAAAAIKTAGADKGKIDSLNQQISGLDNQISSQVAAIVGGSFVTLIGIGIGVLAIVLAPATGGMSLFLLIPALAITAGGVYIITLASLRIAELKQAIDTLRTEINEFNADIVSLQTSAQQIKTFSAELNDLTNPLATVTKPWLSARDYFKEVEGDLETARTSEDWTHVHQEFVQAKAEWQDWVQKFREMELDAKVAPDTQLALGMTEAQIGSALSASKQISTVDYLER